ncbi:hypothetical protein DFA_09480 [Cavenderia fasciculata]|uniref:SET domain-containing protein n=1 Tax=Cavenderia fasciculata TaxID=261658 RepID=F4Q7R2_CACFS|nr:uncharacterized protein DFA_09480 [Cavenderia fasciculata]EGG15812.1 hypothetical protein DFA_09480 [Cavenderia fasciculata]|eukprot:XP_004352137.1 hypothetical protein DFA_09480 [Cavenderia fasciculata]
MMMIKTIYYYIVLLLLLVTLIKANSNSNNKQQFATKQEYVEHLENLSKQFIHHHAVSIKPINNNEKDNIYYANKERGIFVNEDIKEGSDIVNLQWINIFSLDRIKHETPHLYQLLQENDVSAEIGLAISLMYYRYCKDDTTSEYYQWMNSLPTELNTGLYFNPDEIQLLKGSPAFVHLMLQIDQTREMYQKLNGEMFKDKIFDGCAINWDRYKWAVSIVGSRGIYTELPIDKELEKKKETKEKEEKEEEEESLQQRLTIVLAPFIDYFNHNNDAQATYDFDHESSSIRVSLLKSVKSGEQIFLNYGNQNCDSDFLIDYGFVESNINCVNVLFEELLELIPDNDPKLIEKTTILEEAFSHGQRLKLFSGSLTEELLKISKYLAYKNNGLLEFLKQLINLKIANYPTTVEQDKALVSSASFQSISYRSRLATTMAMHEKVVLHSVLKLIQDKITDSSEPIKSNVKDEL